jgi:hypothetical protein
VGFPRKSTLWSGAILGGIVNATMVAQSADYAASGDWNCNHFEINGGDGREGVITFAGGHWFPDAPLVALFHDVHSEFYNPEKEIELERYFQGCPTYQRSLAEQTALPALRIDFHGKTLHRVTVAFWDDGDFLAAPVSWESVLANGASLIENLVIDDPDAALAAWQQSYAMSAEQVRFARSLWERKLSRPPATIELTPAEVKWLESTFEDPKALYAKIAARMKQVLLTEPEGERERLPDTSWIDAIDSEAEGANAIKLSQELFSQIGIDFP